MNVLKAIDRLLMRLSGWLGGRVSSKRCLWATYAMNVFFMSFDLTFMLVSWRRELPVMVIVYFLLSLVMMWTLRNTRRALRLKYNLEDIETKVGEQIIQAQKSLKHDLRQQAITKVVESYIHRRGKVKKWILSFLVGN